MQDQDTEITKTTVAIAAAIGFVVCGIIGAIFAALLEDGIPVIAGVVIVGGFGAFVLAVVAAFERGEQHDARIREAARKAKEANEA